MSLTAPFPWLVRLSWLVLPFSAGPAWAAALDARSEAVGLTAAVLLWAAWGVGVLAVLIPRPLGLTIYRVVAPASLVAATAAALGGGDDGLSLVVAAAAVVSAGAATALALLPETGELFVDGGAYGDERRHLLRAPGPVLAGPVFLAWGVLAAGVVTGPLLLAARQWVAGAFATLIGAGLVVVLGRALHSLATRWVVFVPAGMVLKDHLALVDPVLFRRTEIEVLRPAPANSDSLDLTARSPGLALELLLHEKVPMLRASPGRRRHQPGNASRLLFTPSRPGAVLREARRRRIAVD